MLKKNRRQLQIRRAGHEEAPDQIKKLLCDKPIERQNTSTVPGVTLPLTSASISLVMLDCLPM